MGTRTALVIGVLIGATGSAVWWRTGEPDAPPPAVPQPAGASPQQAAEKTASAAVTRAAPTYAQATDAKPTTPDYGPRNEGSPAIYRCGARGATVYSNTPCVGARVVDESSAVSGFDSRPSDRMARLVAQGRVVDESTSVGPVSRVRPRNADEGADCATMRRQIRDLDAAALQPNPSRWLDELRAIRQDIRTRMAREHC